MSREIKKSSKIWLREHFADPYVKRAQQEGLRARSVYKLKELNERYSFIKPGMQVVELGAAPGSWSEYTVSIVGDAGQVLAIDLLPMRPIDRVKFIQGDFTSETGYGAMMQELHGEQVEVILSDMAPNLTGIKAVDQARSIDLVSMALRLAEKVLKKGGSFFAKVFQGEGFSPLVAELRVNFTEVKILKPSASRARSSEVFVLARNFRKISV